MFKLKNFALLMGEAMSNSIQQTVKSENETSEVLSQNKEIKLTDAMKKVVISPECISCGLCVQMSEYIDESATGKAIPKGAGALPNDEVKNIEQISELCPVKAIKVENAGLVKSQGKEGLIELKHLILSEFGNYKVPMPNPEDYKFCKELYFVEKPISDNEYEREYNSYERAMREGLREFDRIMYSKRKTLIQQVLVDYKHRVLGAYSTYNKDQENYYYSVCCKVSKQLQTYVFQLQALLKAPINIDESLYQITSEPIFGTVGNSFDREMYVYKLKHLEKIWVTERVMNELEPLKWFDCYVNVDDIEDYRGRDKYYYQLGEIKDTLEKQILSEIGYVLNAKSGVQSMIESSFELITQDINKEVEEKVQQITKIIDSYL